MINPERTRESLAVLCNEQTRMMLAQNAATLGRLAAALSHEMNTPLGVLKSSVDTLMALAQRDQSNSQIQRDLLGAIRESSARLADVVARMQRFTNLNRAEVQPMCMNGLISDAAALLDPGLRTSVELNLEPRLPYVMGHPQQLSAVLFALLSNAVESGGSVVVATRASAPVVKVEIRDSGRGIAADLLQDIFEPSFRERDGRITAGNWNLFSCRQIVEAHGGQIDIASARGVGSAVSITLPAHNEAA
jgi:signal transduction histidine kinase